MIKAKDKLASTADLGVAIKDHLESKLFETSIGGTPLRVETVDVDDGSNLVVVLDNGQAFKVRIYATAGVM